jgi:hypothetical protein
LARHPFGIGAAPFQALRVPVTIGIGRHDLEPEGRGGAEINVGCRLRATGRKAVIEADRENLADIAGFYLGIRRLSAKLARSRGARLKPQNLRRGAVEIDEESIRIAGNAWRTCRFRSGEARYHGFAARKNGVVLRFRRRCGEHCHYETQQAQASHPRISYGCCIPPV